MDVDVDVDVVKIIHAKKDLREETTVMTIVGTGDGVEGTTTVKAKKKKLISASVTTADGIMDGITVTG